MNRKRRPIPLEKREQWRKAEAMQPVAVVHVADPPAPSLTPTHADLQRCEERIRCLEQQNEALLRKNEHLRAMVRCTACERDELQRKIDEIAHQRRATIPSRVPGHDWTPDQPCANYKSKRGQCECGWRGIYKNHPPRAGPS